jgi:hypothetical protein
MQYIQIYFDFVQFLEDEFLGYLQSWKNQVENRLGNFTKSERKKMFISQQTYEGIQRTGLHFKMYFVQYQFY